VLDEVRDVMAGGGSGLAMGRAIFQEPSPGAMAEQVAEIVHGQ
jgi:DhnA family fructose-bisphosphate aldolase class Ia